MFFPLSVQNAELVIYHTMKHQKIKRLSKMETPPKIPTGHHIL
jgi:hypothetical protein